MGSGIYRIARSKKRKFCLQEKYFSKTGKTVGRLPRYTSQRKEQDTLWGDGKSTPLRKTNSPKGSPEVRMPDNHRDWRHEKEKQGGLKTTDNRNSTKVRLAENRRKSRLAPPRPER